MLRGTNGSKKLVKLLLHCKTIFGLTLVAALWLTSISVSALVYQQPVSFEPAHLPVATEVNIAVSSTGCNPSSATQTAGQITLKVTNQTGQAELAVQLYGSHGELIREVNIRQGATE